MAFAISGETSSEGVVAVFERKFSRVEILRRRLPNGMLEFPIEPVERVLVDGFDPVTVEVRANEWIRVV